MARNRVIYQSEGLFVSSGASAHAAAEHKQLRRVQSANYSYTINRQDVNQYGQLARIDSLVLDPPTVSVDFSYYLTDGFNERAMGFYVQTGAGIDGLGPGGATAASTNGAGNFASGHLGEGSGLNVFIVTSPENDDLNIGGAIGSAEKVIGIGNAYPSDYSVDLSVGSLPTVSVTMEGANIASSAGNSITSPAIDQENGTAIGKTVTLPTPESGGGTAGITALRPGDITMNLSTFESETIADLDGTDSIHIQSASLSLPLSRTPLDRLGSKFAFARTVDFPITTTLSVSAIMNEETAMNLAAKLEEPERDVQIMLKTPGGATGVIWDFKQALVDSESFSSSIGSNKTVDLTFSAQVGGPEDITAGVFLSGVGTGATFA